MADEQDRPDQARDFAPPAAEPPASAQKPPAKRSPAKPAKQASAAGAAKKTAAKAAKKAPTKAVKGPEGTPKKAAKKVAKKEPPPLAVEPLAGATLGDTNGETPFGAADETAANARHAVETAGDSLATATTRVPGRGAQVPIAVALVMALLAILLIRRLRSDG